MMARFCRLIAASCVLAASMLVFEPGLRPGQRLDAASWQLYWGSEYNYCEGCCGSGFCCNISHECMVIVT
ncbi:MAG TPA: hypothetical protein VFY65_02970 [Longimicrobium sp.]|nr:hypothetical protein [Longimicrobium sp.]